MKTMRGALAVGLLMCGASGASMAANSASAAGLTFSWGDGGVPTGYSQVSANLSPLNWACGAQSCSLTELPTVNLVFGASGSGTHAVTSEALSFRFSADVVSTHQVTDPLGQTWDVTPLLGTWSLGVDITQNHAPADYAFNSAHGQFGLTTDLIGTSLMSWSPSSPPFKIVDGKVIEQALVNKTFTGSVSLGPGAAGRPFPASVGGVEDWELSTKLFSPYYALPSTTDPRCASMSCMNYQAGVLDVSGYRFSMSARVTLAASSTPAIPEPGTVWMGGLGLAVLALQVARRRRG